MTVQFPHADVMMCHSQLQQCSDSSANLL